MAGSRRQHHNRLLASADRIRARPSQLHNDSTIATGAALATPPGSYSANPSSSRTRAIAPETWEAVGWAILAGTLIGVGPWVFYRTANNAGSDFPDFWRAGRYVLEHGLRHPQTLLAYYWPSVDVGWMALAWMPLRTAAAVWYFVGCATWLGILRAANTYLLPDVPQPYRRRAVLTAGLLLLPLVIDHLCLGAFHMLMVWWMLAGLGHISQGRDTRGGLLLGLAIWVKFLPGIALGYLLLKRKWKAAAIALAMPLLVHIALSGAAFGLPGSLRQTAQWWEHGASGTAEELLASELNLHTQQENNQSLLAVLRRTLTTLGSEADPLCPRLILADLSPAQLRAVYSVAVVSLLVLGAWLCRHPASRLAPSRWATEIGVLLLATMWFSPIVWSYHPTAAAPALAVLLGRVWFHKPAGWSVVFAAAAAQALIVWPLASSLGEMLWTTLALGAALFWLSAPLAPRPSVSRGFS